MKEIPDLIYASKHLLWPFSKEVSKLEVDKTGRLSVIGPGTIFNFGLR